MPTDIASMDLQELEAALQAGGHPAYHARQIYAWIYRKASRISSR
jgi:adenine C2-methylase RlmN of 23S rRNA A2503 and tRNA A37